MIDAGLPARRAGRGQHDRTNRRLPASYEFTQNLSIVPLGTGAGGRQDPAARERRPGRRLAERRRLVRTRPPRAVRTSTRLARRGCRRSEGSGRHHRRPAGQHPRAAEHPPRQPDGERLVQRRPGRQLGARRWSRRSRPVRTRPGATSSRPTLPGRCACTCRPATRPSTPTSRAGSAPADPAHPAGPPFPGAQAPCGGGAGGSSAVGESAHEAQS